MQKILPILFLLLLAIVGFGSHANSLHNDFQFDDLRQIQNNPLLQSDSFFPKEILGRFPYRAGPYWTFLLNARLGGLDPFGFHIGNLLIHVLNAFLIFLIFGNLTSRTVVAILPALVFLLNPLSSEMINHVVLRTELLATFFYLLGFYLYLKKRSFLLVIPFFLLAIDAKASAISLPVVFLLHEFLPPTSSAERLNKKGFLQILICSAIFTLAVFFLHSKNIIWQRVYDGVLPYATTQISVIGHYLFLYLVPVGLNIDYDIPIRTFSQWETLVSLTCLLGTTLFLFWWRKKNPLALFLWLWTFVAILPTSSIIPREDLMVLYRFYLPSAAFSMFLVSLFLKKRFILFYVFIPFAIFLGLLTYERNFLFQDELTLWEDTAGKSPNKERVINNYGQALLKKGRIDEGIMQFERLLTINPNKLSALNNLGLAYQKKGNAKEAEKYLAKAYKLSPQTPQVIHNLAIFYRRAKQYEKAMQVLERLLAEYGSSHPETYDLLGKSYFEVGFYERAYPLFLKAFFLEPMNSDYSLNLGRYFERVENRNEAETFFKRAIDLAPDSPKPYNTTGLFYKRQQIYLRAELLFLRATEMDPGYYLAFNNLGNLYFEQKMLPQAEAAYQKALAINPDFKIARENLEWMTKPPDQKSQTI